ncbi:hypothetical protein AB1Y20_007493 [Prymnesium parvum]|uniref:Uncharacterized protein n=1 Tax=Prymnesium parvum TaxID=97485 RepID=A0AB34IV57_PRYPA
MSPGPNHGESFFTRSLLLASHSFPHSFPQLCIGAILRFLQLRSYGTLYSILALSCHTGHRSIQGVLPLLIGEFRGTLALFPCLLVGGIHSLLPLLLGGNRGPLALLFRLFFFGIHSCLLSLSCQTRGILTLFLKPLLMSALCAVLTLCLRKLMGGIHCRLPQLIEVSPGLLALYPCLLVGGIQGVLQGLSCATLGSLTLF